MPLALLLLVVADEPLQRFALDVGGVYSVADKYVDSEGLEAGARFQLVRGLSLGAYGGRLWANETGIVANVRNEGLSAKLRADGGRCANPTCEPQLPDLWQPTWFAGAGATWTPLTTTIGLVDVDLFAFGGLALQGITRAQNDLTLARERTRPSLDYGAGVVVRPSFLDHVGLRLGLDGHAALNPDVEEHDPADERICTDGYTLVSGAAKTCVTDIDTSAALALALVVTF